MFKHPGGFIRPYTSMISVFQRATDVCLIAISFWVCSSLYGAEIQEPQLAALLVVSLFFLLFAEAKGLYQSWRFSGLINEIGRVAFVWCASLIFLMAIAFLFKASNQYSRVVITVWCFIAPTIMISLRLMLRSWLKVFRRKGLNSRSLAFVGTRELSEVLASKFMHNASLGVQVIGFFDDRITMSDSLVGLKYVGDISELIRYARAGKLDFVYITLPYSEEEKVMTVVKALADTTVTVYIVPDFFISDLSHARWINMDGIPIVSVFESPFYGVDGWLKRTEDIFLASLILVLISPLMLTIAIAVKVTSVGPILFKQRRYGLKGEVIEVWKFRSMTSLDNDTNVPQATREDPRITRLGRFLRKTSLDELPQFINVIQGRMSIVGPRPHAVAHNEQYRKLIDGYMLRHHVKPGITGLAQINGWRGETDTLDKMKNRVDYDLEYIRTWSLLLDFKIIFITIFKGFSHNNAY